MKLQLEERDPEKLEELQQQQNLLIFQMQSLQASGFQYDDGILQDQIPEPALPQPQGVNTGLQPLQTGLQPTYTGPQPMHTGQQPLYTNQQPVYTGPPPVYAEQQPMNTGPPPMYTSQPAPSS